jgi:hypothetical protein
MGLEWILADQYASEVATRECTSDAVQVQYSKHQGTLKGSLAIRQAVATRAALTFLQQQQISIWCIQRLRITALSENQSSIFILRKLEQTETHNPMWRLNRNWGLLHGIRSDLNGQLLKVIMAHENNERHKKSIRIVFI